MFLLLFIVAFAGFFPSLFCFWLRKEKNFSLLRCVYLSILCTLYSDKRAITWLTSAI